MNNIIFIPEELKPYNQWVMWKYEHRGGKQTKVPYTVGGKRASSTDSNTWTDVDTSLTTTGFDGIGFVFTKNDPFIGIDWDKIELSEIFDEVKSFNSYAEFSPSGKGVHCICQGKIPDGSRCRSGNKEIYSHGRFFTFTGNHIAGTPFHINMSCEQVINDFIEKLTPPTKKQTLSSIDNISVIHKYSKTSKEQVKNVYNKCLRGRHNDLFKQLFSGDYKKYNSQSEADFALCYIIARYTTNPVDVDIIFRSSKLYRTKWNNNYYRERTINMAITNALVAEIEEIVND